MTSEPSNPDLMPALGRLVRGLTGLFWGLPIALVISVQTVRMHWLDPLGIIPPLLANGLLFFTLGMLRPFQTQERVWQRTLDRARFLTIVCTGLSPFLFWFKGMPHILHYQVAVGLMSLAGVLLLIGVNDVLSRLAAMLPDETLRLEARWFTSLNTGLLVALLWCLAVVPILLRLPTPSAWIASLVPLLFRIGAVLGLLLVLLPLSLTMALLWKIKEAILDSVFHRHPAQP